MMYGYVAIRVVIFLKSYFRFFALENLGLEENSRMFKSIIIEV